jgi:hypothetical protein
MIMKRVFFILVMAVAVLSAINGQDQKAKVTYEPKGKWLFEAPYAPEGFTAGTIEIGNAEKKLTAVIAFTGNENQIPLENVKFANDTLSCGINLEGSYISILLKFDEADKMSGKAVTPDGELPLALVREKKK